MSTKNIRIVFLGIAFFIANSYVIASDIEIYTNATPAAGSEPLVMFSLDYRSNLGSTACNGTECDNLYNEGYLTLNPATDTITRFDVLRAVLKKVLANTNGLRIGLMMNHSNENNCAGPNDTKCSNGGYIPLGFRRIVSDSIAASNPTHYAAEIANKSSFHTVLDEIPTPGGNLNHSYQGKELFFEFFRYLTGQGIYNAYLGYNDFGDTNKNTNLDEDFPLISWDTNIIHAADKRYNEAITSAAACSKIFTINFMFQVTNQEDDSDSAITGTKASGGMSGINLKGKNNSFNTVLDWLHRTDLGDGTFGRASNIQGDQNVTSYFIVEPTKINQTTNGYAKAGGTTAAYEWSDDPDELVETLNSIFSQILSVSTTFTAASIPVSVLNRAQVVDNVYLALFQADKSSKPRWPGNLKKLKLNGGTLVDNTDPPQNAVAIDGRIRHDALTFWTKPASLDDTNLEENEVAGKDGRSVVRGGAGQRIPGYITGDPGDMNSVTGARQIFYEPASYTTGATPPALDATSTLASALQTELGAADSTEALEILRFARGYDVNDEDADGSKTDVRPWLLGDPLHSRPLPINYGARGSYTDSNPDIRILMGANDGYMRMFKNTLSGSAGTESGEEVWAFIPRSLLPLLKTLKENIPASPPHQEYGVDGAPAAYIDDGGDGVVGSGDKAWVYFGLRRGGRNMYAMDISDPDNPKLMWTIKPTGDFSELGYTFSTPRVGKLDWGSGVKPVVMFAGGYDLNKDTKALGTNDSMGNAFYIVDAETGALVWKAVYGATTGSASTTEYTHQYMVNSIPSDITAVDTVGDGLIDRVLFGDTGGIVWRVDVHNKNRLEWKISGLASLGRMYNNSLDDDRRFFHRPDFVQYKDKDTSSPYDAVIIGSGNRANPLGTGTDDFLYVIKDRYINPGTGSDANIINHGELYDLTDKHDCLNQNTCTSTNLNKGWRVELEAGGEKALATPTTILKRIYFTTYVPPSSSGVSTTCEPNEGTGYLYVMSLDDASAVTDYDLSNNLEDGTEVLGKSDRKEKLDSGGIPAEIVFIPDNLILKPSLETEEISTLARWKTFWYPVEN